MKRFIVIGGEYLFCNFGYRIGESDTLRGAKQIASKHKELWHDCKYHTPKIYFSKDCGAVDADGYITLTADPVSVYDEDAKTWEDFSPVFGEL